MDDQDIGVLAGFIAGEAHFGLTKNYQWKPYIKPRLSIQIHERDREILEQIHKNTGVGKLKDRNNRPHSTWFVQTKDGLEEIVSVIDRCTSPFWKCSDKYENYEIWREAVEIHLGDATTTEERIEMAEMAKELNKDAGHNNVDWDEFIERLEDYE